MADSAEPVNVPSDTSQTTASLEESGLKSKSDGIKSSEGRLGSGSKQDDTKKPQSASSANATLEKVNNDNYDVDITPRKNGKDRDTGEETRGNKQSGGWKSDQGKKQSYNDRPPGRFSKQNRQFEAGAKSDTRKTEAEGSKDDSQAAQQPKGKRYERDRRESWRGRNERRNQQQQLNEKGKEASGSENTGEASRGGKDGDSLSDQSNDISPEGKYNKNGSSGNYKKGGREPNPKDGKDKFKQKGKAESSQYYKDGKGSDQSGKAEKNSRDKDGHNNKQQGKHGGSGGRDGRKLSQGEREKSHGDGKSSTSDSKHRKDSGSKDGERGRRNSDKDKDQPQLNLSSGADLLNLLNQTPPKLKSKSKDTRGGRGSRLPSAADLEAKWQEEEEEKRRKEEQAKRMEEEKRRKEEEEKRAEEERIRLEEERKKREEEEARRIEEEERRMVTEYLAEVKEKNAMKAELRMQNFNAVELRPDESFFTKLDSSLKKNTAFVKRLKNLTEPQKESLVKDFNGLNLSKYVGEAAASITEAKLKMSDIPCALHICSLLHQRYVDFSTVLLENWHKVLPSKKEEKAFNASKLRVDLRFFAELVACGVFSDKEGLPVLANLLTLLMSNDKEEHNNLSIILSFCKHCGDDYAGLLPRKHRLLAEKYGYECESSRSTFLPKERQKACRHLLKDYYISLSKHLIREHSELKSMEKQNRKILQTKGEIGSDRKERYETAQQTYQKLLTNTAAFSDTLDELMPDLPLDDLGSDSDATGLDLFNPMKNAEYQYEGDSSLFEDDDTRTFYENLPDLKAFIPGILYKDSENAAVPNAPDEAPSDDMLEEEIVALEIEDIEGELEVDKDKESDKVSNEKDPADTTDEEFVAEDLLPEIEEDDTDIASSMKLIMEGFLNSLPNCVNRELIDKAAIDFCMNLNTKSNRRKLVRALYTVQRTRYDLLPFYARLVATLHPCMPDVAADLVVFLKGDFRWHVRKKDQINIESKLKTVRFIGELVKFKMFPTSDSLTCLKLLLHDFSHHNIEMACALLETCGRFLYRSAESHHRTKVYLDVMMRKKAALHLDSRYATMIENAYYYSNPPEVKSEGRKVRPPMHEYIRRLLYKDLSKITTEKVLRQMRKLCWDDQEIAAYATKCLTAIWNVRYNSIHCVANLLAGLAPYHEHVAIQVVDGILEEIRLGMEINIPKFNQRRVCAVKFLGELYNYRMVESAVIFKSLYSLISFGVSMDVEQPSEVDPPEHLFRIRLVCVILDTCGQYFDRGSSKKKLDCFIVYFQKYYWFKRVHPVWSEERPFPMDIEYLMKDVLEALRPKLKLFESYEESCEASEKLDEEFRNKLADILPTQSAEDTETDDDSRLPAIKENDENDELSQGFSQPGLTGEDHSTQESDLGGTEGTGSQSQPVSFGQSGDHRSTPNDSPLLLPRKQRVCRDEGEEGQIPGSDEEEDSDDELMESAGEDEDEDQVTVLTGGPKFQQCQEDDDFMAAFDKMIIENIQSRAHEAAKVPQVDIAVPMHLRGQKAKAGAMPVIQGVGIAPPSPPPEEETNHINFVLMTKRGNKQQFTTLNVPISAEFATKFREREEAERAEKERLKRVVLDIHERQEEEDYQEMLASLNRPVMANTNRERRVRYQHPKGAPDADLIFGSK